MADHPLRYPPIAPKGPDTEPPAPSRSPDEIRTKRASTACGECKQRRTKVLQSYTSLRPMSLPSISHYAAPRLLLPHVSWKSQATGVYNFKVY